MFKIFLYSGSALPIIWGISHLIPTKNVVAGFGNITNDNRRIITMEWIVEGVSLVFTGLLVALVTFLDPMSKISYAVYYLSVIALFSLAAVSFLTGFRINFLPFKMCPFVLSLSALSILIGIVLQR